MVESILEQYRTKVTMVLDKVNPLYSSSCGHELRRLSREGIGQYCPLCNLLVPDSNLEGAEK